MTEEQITSIYMKAYFWLLLTVQTILVITQQELETQKGMFNTLFSYVALIPFYGYIYDRKLLTKRIWQIFALIFFAWEIGCCVYLYNDPLIIDVMLIIMLSPLYWSIVMYVFISMEDDEVTKAAMTGKRNHFQERFRNVIIICNVLAVTFLVLGLIGLLYNP